MALLPGWVGGQDSRPIERIFNAMCVGTVFYLQDVIIGFPSFGFGYGGVQVARDRGVLRSGYLSEKDLRLRVQIRPEVWPAVQPVFFSS